MRRSGSSCSCLIAVRLRADEAVAEHVVRVAADRDHLPALGLDLETACGFAEWAGPVVRGHRRSLLPQLDPERARRAGEHAVRVVQRRGGAALATVHLETPRQDRVRLAHAHAGSRAARPGWRAPSAVPRRSSRPARSWDSRAPPTPAPAAPSRRRRSRARRGVQHAPKSPSRSGRAAGKMRIPSPASRAGPQTTQLGKGCSAVQISRPASSAAATSPRGTASGTSKSSSVGPPSATSVSPSRSSTRSPSRTTSSGRSSGGGFRSDTSTSSAPDQLRDPTAGVAAVRRSGRAVEARRDGERLRRRRHARAGSVASASRRSVDGLEVEPEQVVVAVANDPVLVHDDHRALRADHGRVGAVLLGHLAALVCEQRHVQPVLLREALVRVDALRRDAHHRRVERAERLGVVAVGAELLRADRGVVAGIEEQHDALATVVRELEAALGALAARSPVRDRLRQGAWP